jgi:FAD/FMN-containing dehydrogenase
MPFLPPEHTFIRAVSSYAAKKNRLLATWNSDGGPLRLEKGTISNLFRYEARGRAARRLALSGFNDVIALDAETGTLDVEGLTTFETIVEHCLPQGFLPLVAPELKHITIGGATVGIGIESTCFKYGFVHDSLIEADVVLPDGRIVTCSATNEHSDLFGALPNSYGTLGYILRAKIRLHRARPYTHLEITKYSDADAYLDAMKRATEATDLEFVEGLFFEDRRFFLMKGRMVDEVPRVDDILRRHIFYKLVESRNDIYLRTQDYIFRYDPEWFWNLPDTFFYTLFRRFAPKRLRNSGFYTKYVATKEQLRKLWPGAPRKQTEPLIQDWEVPWSRAAELVEFCLAEVDLDGRPWAAVPIKTPRSPTIYPIKANELYFNLGCYCQVKKPAGKGNYHYTRIMDAKCFALGGIKMLYSSTFLSKREFDERFNGSAYESLKEKYDREGNAMSLYDKVAIPLG